MIIKDSEKAELLRSFPNIELSYETFIHKKVYDFDYIVAIPEGHKYFAWFTLFRNQNVCMILEITENKQINNIEIVHCSFKDNLCYGVGTILYGTLFYKNHVRFFSIEDIFYSGGTQLYNVSILKKIYFLKVLFDNELKQISYLENSIVFGLPLMKQKLEDLLKETEKLKYKIQNINYVKHRSQITDIKSVPFNKINQILVSENSMKREKVIVFKVKPDLQNDIYHLYTDDDHYIGIAYISNYNCSVMMNKLFRNIKENQNLDALEESDDEEEFQDDRLDKFVNLDCVHNIACFFNHKFKKWEPVRVANKEERIIRKRDLSPEKNKL
jgi:hypothetical protein